MHGHFTTPFSGGSTPSESGIRNVYSAGESEILSRIGEEDASLPISQENLEILLGEGSVIAQGLSNLAIATEMPVNLAEGTTESLAMAISGETLKVTPSGTSLPVSGDVGVTKLPPVSGSVGVTTLPPVTISGPITLSGPITIAGTVPVEIVGGLSQTIVDNQAIEDTLGGPTILS